MADFTWIGTSSGNWSDASNWAPVGGPPNSDSVFFENVAACIDSATTTEGSDLATIIDDLRFMTMPQLLVSLNQMQPSLFNGFIISQEEIAIGVHSSLARRLNSAHFGKCSGNEPWHIWFEPGAGRSHERDLKQEPGFKTHDESVSGGGVDYFFSPHGYLGGGCRLDKR